MPAIWSDFHPYVLHLVRGASQPLVEQCLREAARELCSRTLVWQDSTRTISVIADQTPASYAIPEASLTEAVQVIKVYSSTQTLSKATPDSLDMITAWEAQTAVEATHFFLPDPATIRLYPIPTTSYTLYLRAAYRPSAAATGIADFLFEDYRDVIVSGALALLYTMPGQVWSNPKGADHHSEKFIAGIGAARGQLSRGHHYGVLRVTPIRF